MRKPSTLQSTPGPDKETVSVSLSHRQPLTHTRFRHFSPYDDVSGIGHGSPFH